MPLDAEHIGAAWPRRDGLDQPVIGGDRFHRQAAAEPVDTLLVNRVDAHPLRAGRVGQPAAGAQLDVVAVMEQRIVSSDQAPL